MHEASQDVIPVLSPAHARRAPARVPPPAPLRDAGTALLIFAAILGGTIALGHLAVRWA